VVHERFNVKKGENVMPKVEIRHNPYLVHTEIRIDGQEIGHGSSLKELVNNSRLQIWVDQLIPKLKEHLNVKEADLVFHGTATDCEDIADTVAQHKSELNVILNLSRGGNPGEKLEALKDLVKDARMGPVEELRNAEFNRAFAEALDPRFEISILAPLKAGKSTFINAILGQDLFPENVNACTATIIRLEDDDNATQFTGYHVGPERANDEGMRKVVIKPDLLRQWNCENNRCINLYGNIPFVESSYIRLVLVDTPGPNNARNVMHRQATENFIKNSSKTMVFYLLNISQYESDDNEKYFRHIAESMRSGGRQSCDRIVFIVTRMDDDAVTEGNIGELINNKIKCYLMDNGVGNARVLPVSAKLAKLSRMKKHGLQLTDAEEDTLDMQLKRMRRRSIQLYRYASPRTNYVDRYVEERINRAQRVSDEFSLMECNWGLTTVEATIQEFTEKYALPMKIHDACQEIKLQLDNFRIRAHIIEDINKNDETRIYLNEQMAVIKNRLNKGKESLEFKKKVEKLQWVGGGQYESDITSHFSKIDPIFREAERILNEEKHYLEPQAVYDSMRPIYIQLDDVLQGLADGLKKNVEDEVNRQYINLQKEYNQYVKELLGDISIRLPKVNNLMLPRLPSLSELLAMAKERVKVGKNLKDHWSDWLLLPLAIRAMFEKQWEPVYKNMVNKEEFLRELANNLNSVPSAARASAESEIKKDLDKIRVEFLKIMDNLDDKIKKLVDGLDAASKSKESATRAQEKLLEKQQWLEQFVAKLDNITAI
jgi:hypothetical protein